MGALLPRLLDQIRSHGPMTVAAFMEQALYDPEDGYYTGAAQRSGRAGDFFTSVDVGPLFGELLAELVARAASAVRAASFDLVEAGAGNGRLMRDVLDALRRQHPDLYPALHVTLVERSGQARAQHAALAAEHPGLPISSRDTLPDSFEGLLVANELLDAFPVHRLVQTESGLREAYIVAEGDHLQLDVGPLSSQTLSDYLEAVRVSLPPGATVDISPGAVAWTREAARRLRTGALLLVDYGHEAATLFSGHHLGGTLVSYARHHLDPSRAGDAGPLRPAWLEAPGTRDLTAHVDFTSVGLAAEQEGARRACLVDQTRLLLGLGLAERFAAAAGTGVADVKWRLAAKALASPQGLGGTHKALLLTKGIDGTGLVGNVT